MAILNNNDVQVERDFQNSKEAVFAAIGKGILFQTCGANPETMKLDFRVGGAYELHFPDSTVSGEFKEIVPSEKVIFTWDHGPSLVTIRLKQIGSVTHLSLLHTEVPTPEYAKMFDWGWRDGLNDFSPHVGRTVEVKRVVAASIEKTFAAFAGSVLFAKCGAEVSTGSIDFKIGGKYSYKIEGSVEGDFVEGEFTDIIENRRVAFTWSSLSNAGPTGPTLVAIDFKSLAPNETEIKITHSGFPSETSAKDHKHGWGDVLEKPIS